MEAKQVIAIIYKERKTKYSLLRIRKAILAYNFTEKEIVLAIARSEYTFIMKAVLIKAVAHSKALLQVINDSKGDYHLPNEIKKYYDN